MKTMILLFSVTLFFFASCKKEKTEENTPVTPNYYQLKTGNYWVYEKHLIDSTGADSLMTGLDSMIIAGDSIISGNVYYVFKGKMFPKPVTQDSIVCLLRDSSGYLVDEHGSILFSTTNYTDTLNSQTYPGIFHAWSMMKHVETAITVPAGVFQVEDMETTIILLYPSTMGTRYLHNYFANGTGPIFKSYYYISSNRRTELRLLRYHLN